MVPPVDLSIVVRTLTPGTTNSVLSAKSLVSTVVGACVGEMIHFFLMINKQGTCRITKFYGGVESAAQRQVEREVFQAIVNRERTSSNICHVRHYTVVYHRYVGLYVVLGVDDHENLLLAHETIHNFVELLDTYFGTVRELDIIYHFIAVYAILDEYILAGELYEADKSIILQRVKLAPQLSSK